ncbi:hypothetical protein [Streptomyces albus]|uniref:hypothetical protein n=1 Tax=Streptomyces sp. NRRL F-5639 TaxID=1463867 RepID=UPI00131E4CB4|nr:hypothetical protein [Streptomyces sp. NRRL F-5639]
MRDSLLDEPLVNVFEYLLEGEQATSSCSHVDLDGHIAPEALLLISMVEVCDGVVKSNESVAVREGVLLVEAESAFLSPLYTFFFEESLCV